MITFELGVTENFKTIDIKTKKDYNELLEKLNEIIDKENEDIENISIKNTKGEKVSLPKNKER